MNVRTTFTAMMLAGLLAGCDNQDTGTTASEPAAGEKQQVPAADSAMPASNKPELVNAQENGSFRLTAEKGTPVGPRIKFMPEYRAFGWFTGVDRVEWDVDVKTANRFDVYLEWSVSNEDAGKDFIVETKSEKITGKVEKSGSWEEYKSEKIGQLSLDQGKQKVIFKAKNDQDTMPLLDLREIRFIPVK